MKKLRISVAASALMAIAAPIVQGLEPQPGSAPALGSALESSQSKAESPTSMLPGLPLSGRIFSDVYLPTRDVDNSGYRQTSASIWLQGDPKLGENGFARFILATDALDANNGGPNSSASLLRVSLREGYIGYAKNGFEFRLGRQILPWGKSDAINPTDFLSAKDYTFFNPDEEVRRLGATSLWFSLTPSQGSSPLSFTFVATPAFAQSRLLIPPALLPAQATLASQPVTPPQTIANTETAIKASFAGSNWDASVLAFRGWNHMPEFALAGVAGTPTAPVFNLTQTFHRYRAAGGDGAFTAGNWIFRGESAYVWTDNDDGSNMLIQPSHWDSVVGAERPFGDDFRIQAQFVYRYYPAWQPPNLISGADPASAVANPQIAQSNALLLAYQDKSRPGATLRFAYSNEANGIEAEIFIIGNFVGGDYLIRPKASYSWTDALKTTLGLDYYGGPDDRPLGVLKPYNSLFTEAKYSF